MHNIVAFIIVFALNCIYYKPAFTVAMAFFALWLIFEYKKNHINFPKVDSLLIKSFFCFWIAVIASSLLLFDIESIKRAVEYVYWSLPFWMLIILGYNKNITKGLILGLCISTLIICGYGIYQQFFKDFLRIKSFYPSPNYLGTILAMLIPFLFMFIFVVRQNIYKILLSITLFLSIYCIYFAQSRGALLGLAFGILFYLFYVSWCKKVVTKKIIALIILFCSLCGAYFVYTPNIMRSHDVQRIYILQGSINMWEDHKLVGVGLGNFGKYYQNQYILPQATEKYIDKSHNIVTAFLAETGIIGTFGFIAMNIGILYFVLINLRKNIQNYILGAFLISFIALNVHGMVDSTFNYQAINRLFWGCLGVGYIDLFRFK